MSTIDPTTLDPTKPTTGTALTADVRANELATQNNLAAAKADIEAVEAHVVDTANPHGVTAAQAGADPTGTAAAAVAAHEGAADPHPVYLTGAEGDAAYDALGSAAAVQTNLDAHEGVGGVVRHPIVTTGAGGEGFAPALSGVSTEFLNGTGAWSTPEGGGGIEEAPIDGTPYARQDAGWVSATGSGDVTGPASATDDAVVLFDGTTGKLVKDSTIPSTDIARLSQPNAFAALQTMNGNVDIVGATAPRLRFNATGGLADRRDFRLEQNGTIGHISLTGYDNVGASTGIIWRAHHTGGMVIGTATGGDQGAGTLNAGAIYANGQLVPKGPSTSVSGNFASWNVTDGSQIADSGFSDASFDAAGTAAGAVAAHEAAADPHPVYLTSAEGDAAYAPIAHVTDGAAHTGFLRKSTADTIESGVGFALTRQAVASGGTFSPDPLTGQWVELTGSTATTIALMTNDGAVSVIVPNGLALTLTGWDARGTQPGTGVGLLELRRFGTNHLAVWAA